MIFVYELIKIRFIDFVILKITYNFFYGIDYYIIN